MKKVICIILSLIAYHLLLITSANAATPTPTKNEIISDLKERIASRVAQLKLVERRGIIGTVTESSDTQLTITDLKDATRFIDVDELTKFSSPSAKGSFGISDINKGTKIGALGLYNKQSRRLLARFIDVLVMPKVIHGAVTKLDNENFTLQAVSEKGDITTIDIENITKTLSYTKATGLIRSGFSKIKPGQRIIVIGFPDIKQKSRIIASRIIIFPELAKNPKIVIPQNIEEIVPSTGSGKKITPIIR